MGQLKVVIALSMLVILAGAAGAEELHLSGKVDRIEPDGLNTRIVLVDNGREYSLLCRYGTDPAPLLNRFCSQVVAGDRVAVLATFGPVDDDSTWFEIHALAPLAGNDQEDGDVDSDN